MRLSIYREDILVGRLFSSDAGICFEYDREYLKSGGWPISISMPLRADAYPQSKALAFFEGLLPEGEQRRELSNLLHVSSGSTMRLLAALAGECVGNLIVLQEDMDIGSATAGYGYQELSATELEALLRPQSVDRMRFLAARRLSLAGAQAKFGLFRQHGDWLATQGLAPTSHIIKPCSQFDPSVLANELFMMRLAGNCGLDVPDVSIIQAGEYSGLAIERFDRKWQDGRLTRLAQEDFCQALAVMPQAKYENDGGPGFGDVFELVKLNTYPPFPNLHRLLSLVMFNYLAGNCDAHAKNFSLLRDPQTGRLSLAPAYDLVCTTFYGERLLTSMAMRIGEHSQIERICREDFAMFAQQVGLDMGAIREVARGICQRIISEAPIIMEQVSAELPQSAQTVKPLSEHVLQGAQARCRILEE